MDDLLLTLKALAEKNRLRIFSALLSHEELCACQITEFLQVSGATASRHLSLMVNAGVLKNRKQGRWIYFRLNIDDPSLEPAFRWVKLKIENSNQVKKDLNALKGIMLIPDLCPEEPEETPCPEKSTGGSR